MFIINIRFPKSIPGNSLQSLDTRKMDNSLESFSTLIQIMRTDEDINEKVMAVLRLDSYKRRAILNNWLEQLRIQKAPQNLINAVSAFFNDTIAEQVLQFINKHQ